MADAFMKKAVVVLLFLAGLVIFLFPIFPIQTHAQDAHPDQTVFCVNLLAPYPEGGNALISEVYSLVFASPKAAKLIHGCACPQQSLVGFDVANIEQSAAIGSGLAQAVQSINETDIETAETIASIIANSCSIPLKTAFVQGSSSDTSSSSLSVGSSGNMTGGGAISGNS